MNQIYHVLNRSVVEIHIFRKRPILVRFSEAEN